MPKDRDAIPDYAERSRRLGDLIAAPALPLADIALFLDLPLSTVDKLRAQGNQVEFYEIDGTSGHLDGLFSIGKVADRIGAFMQK